MKPFKVYSNMTKKDGVGVTVVSHNSEGSKLARGFRRKSSFFRSIKYTEADMAQLTSLTASSAHCKQFVKYECYNSVLLYNGDMYGWWVSRDGELILLITNAHAV